MQKSNFIKRVFEAATRANMAVGQSLKYEMPSLTDRCLQGRMALTGEIAAPGRRTVEVESLGLSM